jgi:ribosomal subunit interface protein
MLPVQITMRDVPTSEALETIINDKAQKLTHFYQRILNCHVVIEVVQKHKRQGKLFGVRVDLTVPGKELVVNRKEDEDLYLAINEAFHAIERQLEKYSHRRRGDIKKNYADSTTRGQIARLFPEGGYGFIQGTDGEEFYFNEVSVAYTKFDKLVVGDIVQFLPQASNDGWQAHRVMLEKHIS